MKRLCVRLLAGGLAAASLAVPAVASASPSSSPGSLTQQAMSPVDTQLAELEGSGTVECNWFGGDVAISGNTVVAGAYGYGADPSCEGMFPGGAFVFARTATGWKQTAVLQASDEGVDDWFGTSVAISGNTIAVGATNKDSGAGRVYVFTKTAGGWRQTAELKGSDTVAHDTFGQQLAISGDTIVVNSVNQDALAGNLYIFTKTAAGWQQTAEMKSTSFDALSGDRMVADCGSSSNPQSCVLAKTPAGWKQTGELQFPVGEDCGPAALFGPTIVCTDEYTGGSYAGTAYVFTKTAVGWVQSAQLVASDSAPHNYFGMSAAISGNTIAIGAEGPPTVGGHQAGKVYLFTWTGVSWQQVAELRGSAAANDSLGSSVAMSGRTLVVGGSGYDTGTGRAYVFQG